MLPFTVATPNGANPVGIFESWKAVDDLIIDQLESNTSTLPWWKSVAYSRGLPFTLAMARPLKIAPVTVFVLKALLPELQPLSTPDSLSKMNDDAAPPALKPLNVL